MKLYCADLITYLFTYLFTHLLTYSMVQSPSWETRLQLVMKFPAFHGTRRFITALTSVHQLSLSWASPIQSIYPHPTSWRSILILSTHLCLGLQSGLLPSGLHTYLLTYLLTYSMVQSPSWETRLQLVKKFPAFHGTRRFITALTTVRHLSLSWASPIQSIYPHPTSWRSILILSTHIMLTESQNETCFTILIFLQIQ